MVTASWSARGMRARLQSTFMLCVVVFCGSLIGALGHGVKRVDSSLGLWEAFQDSEVTTIRVVGDLVLERDVWPGDDLEWGTRDYAIPVTRNLTIEGDSEDGLPPTIDFDYMRFRVKIEDGLTFSLRSLRLLGSARDPEEQLVFVFFEFGKECTIVYEDIIAEVAVDHRRSLGRMIRLKTVTRPWNELNPDGSPREQEIEIVPNNDPICYTISGDNCTSGAIVFKDFSNVVLLANMQTGQEWGVILSARRTLLIALDVSHGWPKSREETAGRLTVVVQSFTDLALAIQNPLVATVHLWRDLVFEMSSWPDFDGNLHLNHTLGRDLSIQTHPLSLRKSGPVALDFNLAQNALRITRESTLTLRLLLLDRTCRFDDPQCPLPFFDVEPGSQIIVESGHMRVAVGGTDFEELDEAALKLLPPPIIDWRRVIHHISRFDECPDGLLRPCDRLGTVDDLIVEEVLSTNDGMNAFDANLGNTKGNGTVHLRNLTLILFDSDKHRVLREEDIVFHKQGILAVSNEIELRQAMRNSTVAGVYLTSGVNISAHVWPQNDQIILRRNFHMTTHPAAPVSMVVDFNFLSRRVVVHSTRTLSLEWMNFTRVSNNGDNMHYVPFFSWQKNSTIFLKDVLAQMAIEPSRTGGLDDTYMRSFRAFPAPSWIYDPFGNLTKVNHLTSPNCIELLKFPCEDGALHILQMVQQVPLRDVFPRDPLLKGFGILEASNLLFIANDIERTPLLTREQEELRLQQQSANKKPKGDGISLDKNALMYSGIGGFILLVVMLALVHYYFQSRKLLAPNSRQGSVPFDEKVIREHHQIAPELLGDVSLGALMGVGGFARVYRATWNGTPVAVKVILHRAGSVEASVRAEAMLSIMLRHPHLVQGYHYATRAVDSDTESTSLALEENKSRTESIEVDTNSVPVKEMGSKDYTKTIENPFGLGTYSDCQTSILVGNGLVSSVGSAGTSTVGQDSVLLTDTSVGSNPSQCETSNLYRETWLVQEFCDKGSLSEFLQAGNFVNPSGQGKNMAHIIRTGQDIARGMMYLHGGSIVHGDLKSSNVLLQQSATDPRGYIAKVADFGLSRKMIADRSHMSTTSFGTVTHMPPEVLMQGHLSPRADVYSFGIILWEMVAGDLPFKNMMQMEVMRKVVLEKKRPEIPPGTPEIYKLLIERCWCHEPQQRLVFRAILDNLDELLEEFEQQHGSEHFC